jgi:hypothetical protein
MFMCRFFLVVGLIAVCVIGAGFYFGYFHVGSDSTDGTTHITLTIDQKGMQRDEKKVVGDVKEFGHPSKE